MLTLGCYQQSTSPGLANPSLFFLDSGFETKRLRFLGDELETHEPGKNLLIQG